MNIFELDEQLINIMGKAMANDIKDRFQTADDFIKHMRHDKKVRQGTIRYVLPTSIGKVDIFSDVTDEEIKNLINSLK